MDIKLQIVVTVADAQKYINKCIDSIVSQTYINWDLCVIDDCSQDGTASRLKKYRNNCIHLLKENNISDIVRIVSDLSDKQLVDHYQMCDFLAMPSTREGFGFPLIEALACGKPFISFNVGIASNLNKYGYGIIAKENNDFKKSCLELVKNPIKYSNSKEFVKNKYSWDKVGNELTQLYKQYQENKF